TIEIHRERSKGMVPPLLGHHQQISTLSFDPTGKTLASGSRDGTVRLWNVATGKQLLVLEDRHHPWISSVAFGLAGRLIAVAGGALDNGSTVTLHDAGPAFVPTSAVHDVERAPGQRTSPARDPPGR